MRIGLTKTFKLDRTWGCIQSPALLNPAVWDEATCKDSQRFKADGCFSQKHFSSKFGWVLSESPVSVKEPFKSFLFLFPSEGYC